MDLKKNISMIGNRYCGAKNCNNSRKRHTLLSFFRFPRDEERCKIWIKNAGRDDLAKKPVNSLYRNHCLCAEHFDTNQFMNESSRNKLIWNAVPTCFEKDNLNKRSMAEIMKGPFKGPIKGNVPNKGITSVSIDILPCSKNQNSNLENENIVTEYKTSEVSKVKTQEIVNKHAEENGGILNRSLLKVNNQNLNVNRNIATTFSVDKMVLAKPETHCIGCNTDIIANDERIKNEKLTKQLKLISKKCKSKASQMNRYKKRVQELKAELYIYKNMGVEGIVKNIRDTCDLTEEQLSFIEMQMRLSNSKAKGRRWSTTDREFALSIYNQSSKAYKMLSNIFIMPTIRRLQEYFVSKSALGQDLLTNNETTGLVDIQETESLSPLLREEDISFNFEECVSTEKVA